MIILTYKLLFSLFVIKSYADDIVSDEVTEQNARKDRQTYKRFLDDENDEMWHVSHLKDTDFAARRSGCAEDTFEEKVKRYRKSLQNDGALVEYVSADALPFNESDLVTDVCKIPEKNEMFQKAFPGKAKTDAPGQVAATKLSYNKTVTVETGQNDPKATISDHDKHTTSTDEIEKLNVATTPKENVKEHSDKPPRARKASEYLFSSVEYYEEQFDFDASAVCPDDVEEIVLEQEHIRNYDVQCEQILEWKSLE